MLQAIRLLQQANRSQAPAQIIQGVTAAKAAIAELIRHIMQKETKGRSSFLGSIRDLEQRIDNLRFSVSGSTAVSIPEYNDFVRQSERLKETIHTIYLSVQQMRSSDDSDEVDLMLDWAGELEGILVDENTPKLQALRQVLPIPTPEQIEALGNRQLLLATLREFHDRFQSYTANCFISYEWQSQPFVLLLVRHLKMAGIKMILDIEYGPDMSRNLPNMEREILNPNNYVMVIGTTAYGNKSRAPTGSGVRDEALLIQQRFSRKREDVLLVLLEQIPITSFPHLLNTDRLVYADFRLPASYSSQMMSVLERLYSHITVNHPELAEFVAEKKRLFSSGHTPKNLPLKISWEELLVMTQYIFENGDAGSILTFYERLLFLLPQFSLDKKDELLKKMVEPLRVFLPEKKLELAITVARWLAKKRQEKEIDLLIFESYGKALQLAEEEQSPELETLYQEASALLSSLVFAKLSSLEETMKKAMEKGEQTSVEALFEQFSLMKRIFCTSAEDQNKLDPIYAKLIKFFSNRKTTYAQRLILEKAFELPPPYIKLGRTALKSWKSTFASQEILTHFQKIVGWENGTKLLLAVLGGSSSKQAGKAFYSPLELLDAYAKADEATKAIPFTLFACKSVHFCENEEEVASFLPIIEGVVTALLEKQASTQEHRTLYEWLSTQTRLEPLREHYLSFLPKGPLLDELTVIPNRNGFGEELDAFEILRQKEIILIQDTINGLSSLEADFSKMTNDEGQPDMGRQTLVLAGLTTHVLDHSPQKISLLQCAALTAQRLAPFLHPKLTHLYVSGAEKLSAIEERNLFSTAPLKLPNLRVLCANRCANLAVIQLEALCLLKIEACDNSNLTKMAIKGSPLTEIDLTRSSPLTLEQVFTTHPELAVRLNSEFVGVLMGVIMNLFPRQSSHPDKMMWGGLLMTLRKKYSYRMIPQELTHELKFQGNVVGDDEARAIASVLPSTKLTSLSLGGRSHYISAFFNTFNSYSIGEVGAKALASVLPATKLTSLNLGWNSIRDEGTKALAAALPLTKLTSLNIGHNKIGDEGAKALAAALPLTKLTSLNIGYNKIGDEGAKALANVLSKTTLTSLNLEGNKIEEATRKLFVNFKNKNSEPIECSL